MKLKSQLKIIMSSLIVLLLMPILLYFIVDSAVRQFIIDISVYLGVVISVLGIFIVMVYYMKHHTLMTEEKNRRDKRGYFKLEKVMMLPNFKNISPNKQSKLMVTENFKYYKSNEAMNFYKLDLITEAKFVLNLKINLEYKDLKYIDKLYISQVEQGIEIYIPQRLSQTIENTLEVVSLRSLELNYETLAGENMRLFYNTDNKSLSCYVTYSTGEKKELYTEYMNGVELKSLN